MNISFATTAEDQAICSALRHEVFVIGQGVSIADEVDGLDPECQHVLLREDDIPLGALRIHTSNGVAKIGRVCVLEVARGKGVGEAMMRYTLDALRADPTVTKAKLGSQIAAMSLYARVGFKPVGPRYMEAGIEHQDMVLMLA